MAANRISRIPFNPKPDRKFMIDLLHSEYGNII